MPRIVECLEHAPPEVWDEFARTSPGATIYHTRAWGEMCEKAFDGSLSVGRYYRFDDDTEALIPGSVSPSLAGLGTVFTSVRPSDFGGTISKTALDADHAREISNDLRGAGFLRVVIHGNPYAEAFEIPGFHRTDDHTHSVLLEGGFETVWMERVGKNARRFARQAERQGVRIEEVEAREGAHELYRLYELSAQRWGENTTWRRPWRLCEATAGLPGARLFQAVYEGEVIGASLDYYHTDICCAGWRAFDDSYSDTKVNYLLIAQSLERACEAGCRHYDMGASAGLAGVEEFKLRCGGAPLGYSVWAWEHPAYRVLETTRKGLNRAKSTLRALAPR